MTAFRIRGLDPQPFRYLFGAPESTLHSAGAVRCTVDALPGFPDRVSLRHLEPGARALLVNYEHHAAATPYRARHAIYVAEDADAPALFENELPPILRSGLFSLRAFDGDGMMTDAEVADDSAIDAEIQRMFEDPAISEIHAHFARRGCFVARIERL